jgi:hypothetical protein
VDVSCEHDIESSGSIKLWEVLEWLHNWRLLKKGLAPLVSEWVHVSSTKFSLNIITLEVTPKLYIFF